MNWTLLDFVFAFVVLGFVSAVFGFMVKSQRDFKYRLGFLFMASTAVALLWINGAVGIIGGSENTSNIMFYGILVVLFAGAAISRLRARGLSRTLFLTAGLQLLAGVIALSLSLGATGASWPYDALVLTAIFTLFWAFPAWLFAKSAALPN